MAAIPYFGLGPTAILSIISLFLGGDKTIPTPKDDWREAKLDLLIPAFNEQQDIIPALASIVRQTFKPRRIYLIDDMSQDRTVEYAERFKQAMDLDLTIIERKHKEGKVASLIQVTRESDADVIFLLDADTFLESENYLERVVEELYKGIGIASSSGYVMPLFQKQQPQVLESPLIKNFLTANPDVKIYQQTTLFQKFSQGIINAYRSVIYMYLQNFLYRGQMTLYGSLMGPLGCSVAYRRQYLKNVFDKFEPILGKNLTDTEDIFIGFAFIEEGYRNVFVKDIIGYTQEPSWSEVPSQLKRWSSGFLQTCFLFDSVLYSAAKIFRYWRKKRRDNRDLKLKQTIKEKRKIKEAYRQAFGVEQTHKYGRPIGWIIFTLIFEKFSYPTFVIAVIALRAWKLLLITLIVEVVFFTLMATLAAPRKEKIKYFIESILIVPFRYAAMVYDIYIIVHFIFDIWLKRKKRWAM